MSDLLTGERISLRAVEPEDLDFLYFCENDTSVWRVSNTQKPYSKFILRQYIEASAEDIYTAKQVRLIIEKKEDQKAIGAIDLFDFDPYHQRAGIGIIISDKSELQKGFAREALQLVINYSFMHLNLHQLYCNIGENNTASIKLFTTCGFVQCGSKSDWLKTPTGWENELLFQLIKK